MGNGPASDRREVSVNIQDEHTAGSGTYYGDGYGYTGWSHHSTANTDNVTKVLAELAQQGQRNPLEGATIVPPPEVESV